MEETIPRILITLGIPWLSSHLLPPSFITVLGNGLFLSSLIPECLFIHALWVTWMTIFFNVPLVIETSLSQAILVECWWQIHPGNSFFLSPNGSWLDGSRWSLMDLCAPTQMSPPGKLREIGSWLFPNLGTSQPPVNSFQHINTSLCAFMWYMYACMHVMCHNM